MYIRPYLQFPIYTVIGLFQHMFESHLQWRNYNGFRPGEPGGPNPNELNGGPQAQAVEQKHWPGRPLDMLFSDHQNSVKSLPKVREMAFERL